MVSNLKISCFLRDICPYLEIICCVCKNQIMKPEIYSSLFHHHDVIERDREIAGYLFGLKIL